MKKFEYTLQDKIEVEASGTDEDLAAENIERFFKENL